MKKLIKNFRRLSILDKTRYLALIPIVAVAYCIDGLIRMAFAIGEIMLTYRMQLLKTLILIMVILVPVKIANNFEETVPKFTKFTDYDAQLYVYQNCHEMCNNFIVAEDGKVRGVVRADSSNIDKILSVIAMYDIDYEQEIVAYLKEFKAGDFHSAVQFHNLCWIQLDGEAGYAIKLKDKYR